MIIDFEMSEGGLTLNDALELPDDHDFTDEQIWLIKADRFARWKESILAVNPPESWEGK